MAQLARLTGHSVPTLQSPPGYEVISDTGVAVENIARGQACTQGASGWSKASTATVYPHGIAAKDYVAGQTDCEFIVDGEIDGYSLVGGAALTPGAAIYPSLTTAGELATDVATGHVGVPQMRAISASAIRVRF